MNKTSIGEHCHKCSRNVEVTMEDVIGEIAGSHSMRARCPSPACGHTQDVEFPSELVERLITAIVDKLEIKLDELPY